MQKPNLNKIMAENLNKDKFQSKKQPSLPTGGWLDQYKSGGTYISDRAQATQFGQYQKGGDFPTPYSNEFVDRYQKDYDNFYATPRDYNDDRYDAYLHSIQDKAPFNTTIQQNEGPVWEYPNQGSIKYGENFPVAYQNYINTGRAKKEDFKYYPNYTSKANIGDRQAARLTSYLMKKPDTLENFDQYKMGGGMFPPYHSYAPPRMNNGGGLLSKTVTCSRCGHSWKATEGGADALTCHNCGGMIKMSHGGDISIPDLDRYIGHEYARGGMITDPRGQWAHPGKNTRIPGNDITMQGVPYPVLAKASNGQQTMMYPGQDYSFPGASHVDEYPMMQKGGGWLDKYPDGGTSYTVKAGDNLTKIGRRFGMTPQQIGAANNIQDLNKIRTNQMLNIPGAAQQPIAPPVAAEPSYSVPQMQQPFVPQQKVFTQPVNTQPTITSSPNLSDSEAAIISNYAAPSTSLDTEEDRVKRQKAQKLVELARQHIADNKYFDVPADVAEASRRQGQEPAGCIGGSCMLAKEAGILPKVYWSNTAFAKDAPSLGYPNKGLGLKGIQNLESGDFMVYQLKESGYKDKEGKNKFIPSHLQTFLGVNPETKQYEFFDNYNKRLMTYPESEVKDKLKNTKNSYDYGAVIYKNNPFHPNENSYIDQTQEEAANKDLRIDKQLKTPSNYKYSIRSDAKDYNDSTKKIMDTFVNYANDDTKINDLVSKLSTDKEEIHDSLLNVFGELGQENNWSNSGKGAGSRLENAAEKILTFFGGGKKYSVGPGQNKFKYIPKDLKEKFGIKSTKDLYDMEKVIPLMVAQDIRNKRVLRYWGQKNLLSNKLIGHTDNENPLTADDLKGGVGRWSPYLRNEFGLISNEKRLVNNDDLIPFNTETVSNYDPETGVFMHPRTLAKGSYPDKVAHKWDDNLQRLMINSQQTPENAEVQPNVVMFSKAAKKKPVRAFGGQNNNWLNKYK